MVLGIECVVIHTDNKGGVGFLARRRDDHTLSARFEMGAGGLAAREAPRRLDHDVDVLAGPSDRFRVSFLEHGDLVATDTKTAFGPRHLGSESPEGRVVAEKVRVSLE